MEWLLQVVDELDDAVAVVRHYAQGLDSNIGLTVTGSIAASAVYAALLQVTG